MKAAEGAPSLVGQGTIIDHYKTIRRIGRGGMGEVYLARDLKLGRKAALKVVNPKLLGDARTTELFLREARVTARFSHPNIVTIYGVGEHADSVYVALELLEGQTLRERMGKERLGSKEVVRIGLAVIQALRHAHGHEVLHRDLKPENVFITRDGQIRVLDFGLAVLVRADKASQVSSYAESQVPTADFLATLAGGVCGTPWYMAPEQWQEEPLTRATDVWALGVILLEMAGGHHPYKGLSASRICAETSKESAFGLPDAVREHPTGLVRLIERCLHKDPARRSTPAQVGEALERLQAGQRARGADADNPFRGLLPFTEEHADRFYGRDAEVAAFLERLREEAVIPVVGASGAGKSSFVRAGVVPGLREQGQWLVLQMRPGSAPLTKLAGRLLAAARDPDYDQRGSVPQQQPADILSPESETQLTASRKRIEQLADELREAPGRLSLRLVQLSEKRRSRVLLFVDQLEEVYSLVEDEEERRRFMQALCTAADESDGPVRVIFTCRDDFLGRLAEGAEAREALGRVTVIHTPGPEALKEILTRPVVAGGCAYEDSALVEEMVRAVQGEPAALPLLQFAGHLLWEGRDRKQRLLTRRAYEAIGGVAGALATHTDKALDGLAPRQELIARRIFLRLVTPQGLKKVLPRSALLEGLGDDAPRVLDRLTGARAVLIHKGPEEAELELVHDSLILAWDRLVRWMEESREERVFLAEVGQAAELWERRGRPWEEVWRGDALAEALVKARRCAVVPARVRAFLVASQRAETRLVRRRRLFIAALFVALAGVALMLAWMERDARRERVRAEDHATQAESQRSEALWQRAEAQREGARAALTRGSYLEARAKLRASLETRDSPLARALWWRLQRSPILWNRKLGDVIYDVDFSPDGRTVAAAGQGKAIYLFDVQTHRMIALRGHRDLVYTVAFSPDGRWIASGGWGGRVKIWNLATKAVKTLLGHRGGIRDVAFSPDGRRLVTGSYDRTVRLWDVRTGELEKTLKGHTAPVYGVAFSRDGRRIASGSLDSTVRVWDVDRGALWKTLRGPAAQIFGLAFSPDGRRLAVGSSDSTVRVWELSRTRIERTLRGHGAGVRAVTFSRDGRRIASVSYDKTVRLWSAGSGASVAVLRGHSATVRGVSFGPRGRRLVTGGSDQTVRLWNLDAPHARPAAVGHTAAVDGVSFSPDGKLLATGSLDQTVRLWDVKTGDNVSVLRGHTARIWDVRFSPDGRTVASACEDLSVRLWDVRTGRTRRPLYGHTARIWALAFGPKSQLLASASGDRTVRLWDLKNHTVRHVLRGHTATVFGVDISPDGRRVATASHDQTVRIWDARRGTLLQTLRGHTGGVNSVAFGPTGSWVVSGSWDRSLRIWNITDGTGRTIGTHLGRLYAVDVHPGGRLVGTASSDDTARIWDTASATHRVLRGHRADVNWIRFGPKGKLTATTSDDSTVRLWDTSTGRLVWRAVMLRTSPPELYTHRGWRGLTKASYPGSTPRPERWRRSVEKRALQAYESPSGRLLCLRTHGDEVELWDRVADRRRLRERQPGLQRVVAVTGGCVTLAHGVVRLHTPAGHSREIARGADAVAWDGEALLVAAQGKVAVHDGTGTPLARYPGGTGVSAMTRAGEWLVLGFQDGNIELVPTRVGQPRPRFTFEDVASSAVIRLRPGPMGTLIAGFANGLVGLWSLRNGTRLEHVKLHGPIEHMRLKGAKLYAASALGQHTILDLGIFHIEYCALLRQVWDKVPVVWESGLPVLRPAPSNHHCAR